MHWILFQVLNSYRRRSKWEVCRPLRKSLVLHRMIKAVFPNHKALAIFRHTRTWSILRWHLIWTRALDEAKRAGLEEPDYTRLPTAEKTREDHWNVMMIWARCGVCVHGREWSAQRVQVIYPSISGRWLAQYWKNYGEEATTDLEQGTDLHAWPIPYLNIHGGLLLLLER